MCWHGWHSPSPGTPQPRLVASRPGQVAQGTQHMAPVPRWPGITTRSCCAALWPFSFAFCAIVKWANTILSVGLTNLLIVCDVSNSSSINLILRIYGANIPAPY